jgi:hypothetical protein
MRDYDHCRALASGRVKVDGVDLKFVNISPPSQIFLRMLHDEEFDASEMSLSNFMIAMGKGDRRFRRHSGFSLASVSPFVYLDQYYSGDRSNRPISKARRSASPTIR